MGLSQSKCATCKSEVGSLTHGNCEPCLAKLTDRRQKCNACQKLVEDLHAGRCRPCITVAEQLAASEKADAAAQSEKAARDAAAMAAEKAAARERMLKMLNTVAPSFKPYMDKAPEVMITPNGSVDMGVAALVGHPKCGKSTIVNQMASIVARMPLQVVAQGGGAGVGGHNTLAQRRVPVLERGCFAAGLAKPKAELLLCDLVGLRSIRELNSVLLGKVLNGERWPEDEASRQALEARTRSPLDAVHCLVVVMTANLLLNPNGAVEQAVQDVQALAKAYRPNTDPNVPPFVLPLRLLITHVDMWARGTDFDDPRCLTCGEEGPLQPLYAAARNLGFDASFVAPIGWLDRGDIDYTTGTDARVVVLKFLLHQMWIQAAMFRCDVAEAVPDASA